MIRKTLSIILLTILSVFVNATYAFDFEVDGLYYNIVSTSDRTAALTYKEDVKVNGYYAGYNDYDKEVLLIPSSVEYMGQTLKVIGVDVQAFEYNTAIKKLIIPNNIEWLHQECFDGCTSLEEVIIKDSEEPLTFKMKGRSFYFNNCPIKTLYLGRNIVGPGNNNRTPFAQLTELKDVTLSSNVTSLISSMFSECTSLETLTLPNECTEIGAGAFGGCTALSTLQNTAQISTIGASAFANCSSLVSFKCDGLNVLNENTFFNCSSLSEVELGNLYTDIPKNVFDGCSSLSKFSISEAATRVYSYAFQNCTSLQEIRFPSKVTFVDSYSFNGCESLKSIIIDYGDEPINLGNLFLWKSDKENKIGVVESLVINRNIKNGTGRFFYFTDVKNVTLGDKVTNLNCPFELTLSPDLETIYVYAVEPPTTGWYFHNDLLTTVKVHVPRGTKEVFQNSNSWKDFWNIIDDLENPSTSVSIIQDDSHTTPQYFLLNGMKVNTPPVNRPYIKVEDNKATKEYK